MLLILISYQNKIIKFQVFLLSQQLSVYFYPSGIYILNFCKISILIKHLNLEMLGKYSMISNRRPATTHTYAMHTFFSPWQTSTANVTKPFLHKPAHPLQLNIGTLQNLPSWFHTSRFKSVTSIHCQRPLQKHVSNHIDNVNVVTFVTCKHMSPQGPIFLFQILIEKDQRIISVLISTRYWHTKMRFRLVNICNFSSFSRSLKRQFDRRRSPS